MNNLFLRLSNSMKKWMNSTKWFWKEYKRFKSKWL